MHTCITVPVLYLSSNVSTAMLAKIVQLIILQMSSTCGSLVGVCALHYCSIHGILLLVPVFVLLRLKGWLILVFSMSSVDITHARLCVVRNTRNYYSLPIIGMLTNGKSGIIVVVWEVVLVLQSPLWLILKMGNSWQSTVLRYYYVFVYGFILRCDNSQWGIKLVLWEYSVME